MSWTEERKKQFKALYAQNLSHGRIAAELGGFGDCKDGGRNACIGMAHRLGLTPREYSVGKERQQKTPRFPDREMHQARKATAMRMKAVVKAKFSTVPVDASPLVAPEVFNTDHIMTFMQLENINCRFGLWTGGEPASEQFFCGNPGADLHDGRPYCAFHSRICYTPRSEPKPRPYIPGLAAAE